MKYEIKNVDISSLKEFPNNPRSSSIEPIKESLEKHGQYRPLTVSKDTNEILTGNHTWLAMKELGWKTCDVMFVEVDEARAKKIVLVDNRLNELATYDKEKLADMLGELMELGELFGTGYTADEVDDLYVELDEIDISAFEEFRGGYALTDEELAEAEAKLKAPSERKLKDKMNEIVLAFVESDYQKYQVYLNVIQKRTGLSGSDALFSAVKDLANEINKGEADEPSWLSKLFGK